MAPSVLAVDGVEGAAAEVAAAERGVAFPRGTDVLALARAWFAEAERLEEPAPAPAASRLVGARFGGRPRPERPDRAEGGERPRRLRVTRGATLRGPVAATELPGVPDGLDDAYLLDAAAADRQLSAWLLAAARRAGGAVVDGTGAVRSPAADEIVRLTLYATEAIPPELALSVARSVAPMTRPGGSSVDGYELVLDTTYDGSLTVRVGRSAEVPVCLLTLDRGAYGTAAYALRWQPPDAAAADPRSTAGRIARDRILPLVARLALALRASASGTTVDADGFVVTARELQRRATR